MSANPIAIDEDNFNDILGANEVVDPIPNFPAELKKLPIWLVWKAEIDPETKKINKIPHDPISGRRANDPKKGVAFDVAAANLPNSGYAGLGIYVGGGLIAVDLDNCIDTATGTVKDYAAGIAKQLNCYTEVSVSGKGLHIFSYGEKPGDACRKAGIEIYSHGRFVAVTGSRVEELPATIEKRDIGPIYEQYLGEGAFPVEPAATTEKATAKETTPRQSVQVEQAGSVLTSKLELLMNGEIFSMKPSFIIQDQYGNRAEYPSQSEADLALATLLAFKYRGNAEKIDEDFRASSLMRDKWERSDIRKGTIKKAIESYEKSKTAQSVATTSIQPAAQGQALAPNWESEFRGVADLESGGVKMLIQGFLPAGGVTMIGALPGVGKTWFALSIAKALTTGKPFLGRFAVPEKVPVLYLGPETNDGPFRARCELFHLPKDRKLFLCRTITEGRALMMDDAAVLAAVTALKPVVILDTAIRFNKSTDENSATANKIFVNEALALLAAGAQAVIGLHHATKASAKDGLTAESALRGTGDLSAMAEAVYGLERNEAVYAKGNGPIEIEVTCLKPRDFEPPLPFSIAAQARVGDKLISHLSTKGDFVIIESGAGSEDISRRFIELVAANPQWALTDVAEELGIKKRKAQTMAARLGYRKTKIGWVSSVVKIGLSDDPITLKEIDANE